jgi:hypothetical protein
MFCITPVYLLNSLVVFITCATQLQFTGLAMLQLPAHFVLSQGYRKITWHLLLRWVASIYVCICVLGRVLNITWQLLEPGYQGNEEHAPPWSIEFELISCFVFGMLLYASHWYVIYLTDVWTASRVAALCYHHPVRDVGWKPSACGRLCATFSELWIDVCFRRAKLMDMV